MARNIAADVDTLFIALSKHLRRFAEAFDLKEASASSTLMASNFTVFTAPLSGASSGLTVHWVLPHTTQRTQQIR